MDFSLLATMLSVLVGVPGAVLAILTIIDWRRKRMLKRSRSSPPTPLQGPGVDQFRDPLQGPAVDRFGDPIQAPRRGHAQGGDELTGRQTSDELTGIQSQSTRGRVVEKVQGRGDEVEKVQGKGDEVEYEQRL